VVSSGGFALSFYLQAPDGEQWVVRCFKADSPDRRTRYDAISRFLNAHPDPLLLDVDYYDQGILVNGAWYPVVRMPLVRGVTLYRYIEHELRQGRSIAHLSLKFRAAVRRLEQLGIAHGDLQHGNIMVQAGQLVLVDYDGMYVPELRGWPPAEIGSAAYQHPLRADQFDPTLDRFSAIVIDLALQALTVRPDWWAKYNTGENLLFRRADFLEPQASPLLAELEQIPHLRAPARDLRAICQAPFEATPRLENAVPPLSPPASSSPVLWSAPSAGQADDIDEQLDRLYASWSPQTAPAVWANAAPSVTVVAAAPPAPPALPTTSAQQDNWQEVAGLLRMLPKVLRVVWFTFIFSLTFGRMILGGLVDLVTPDPILVLTPTPAFLRQVSVDDLPAQAAAAVCPADLYVSLAAPRDTVKTKTVEFAWRANEEIIPPCRFQLKLWRQDETPMLINLIAPPEQDGRSYSTRVLLSNYLPAGEQHPGAIYWTVQLVAGRATNNPIPIHGVPLEFNWEPPG